MKYKFKKLEKNQVEITMDFTAEEWANYVNKAYEENKGKYKVEGFRQGKAPKSVIEKMYGEHVFIEEGLNLAFAGGYTEILEKEQDFEPIADPKVDIKALDKTSLKLHVLVDVMPEVKLGAYEGLEIKKEVRKATAEEVEHELHHAQEHAARIMEVEHDLENGNIANIDFEGSIDGVKFEGGTATNYDLEIGSGSFIQGFEDQMVGMKKGEKRDIKVTFPAEYGAPDLAGKDAVFAVTLHAVKEKQLPELDDEFAKDVSEFDTLAEYKNDIKNKMKEDAEHRAEHAYEDALIDAIVNNATVEIPEAMIDNEADDMVHEFEYRLMYQGIKLDDYLTYVGMDRDGLKKEYREQAEKSVKIRLVMEQIVRTEDLKFSDEEIDEKLSKMAADAGKDLDTYRKALRKEQIDYIVNQILSDKLMALLKKENSAVSKASAKKADDAVVAEEKPAPKKAPAKKTTKKAE